MRVCRMASLVLGFALLGPAALAQGAYFVDGQRVFGMSAFTQRHSYDVGNEHVRGSGVEMEVLVTPRLALVAGGGSTSDSGLSSNTRTQFAGLGYYAGRQGLDGPFSAVVMAGIGRVSVSYHDGMAYILGLEVSRYVRASETAILSLLPSVAGTATFLSVNDGIVTSHGLSADLGLGMSLTQQAVLFVEPNLMLSLSQGGHATFLGVAGGLAFAL